MKSISKYDGVQNEIDVVLAMIEKYRNFIDDQKNKRTKYNFSDEHLSKIKEKLILEEQILEDLKNKYPEYFL